MAEKKGESSAAGSKTEISGAQVTGTALASITAAYLGSHLGVAGTVFGAGLTSVVISVGGALYQRSLERTKEKLGKERANATAAMAALKRATKAAPKLPKIEQPPRRRPGATSTSGEAGTSGAVSTSGASEETTASGQPQPSAPSPADEATRKIRHYGAMQWPGGEPVLDERRISSGGGESDGPTRKLRPAGAEAPTSRIDTSRISTSGAETSSAETSSPGTSSTGTTRVATGDEATEVVSPPAPRRRGLRWGVVAATSALAFLLGMLLITGWEGITGKTLAGDQGTTVGRVFRPAPPPQQPAPEQAAPEEPSQEPEPTTTRTPEPTTAVRPTEAAPSREPSRATSSPVPSSPSREMPSSTAPVEPTVPGTGFFGPTETSSADAP